MMAKNKNKTKKTYMVNGVKFSGRTMLAYQQMLSDHRAYNVLPIIARIVTGDDGYHSPEQLAFDLYQEKRIVKKPSVKLLNERIENMEQALSFIIEMLIVLCGNQRTKWLQEAIGTAEKYGVEKFMNEEFFEFEEDEKASKTKKSKE